MISSSATSNQVTLVEVLELIGSFAEFSAVSQSLARRLEAEGIAELVAVQFYATANTTEIGGLLTFSDYHQIVNHIAMITQWEEFKQLLSLARLVDMRVYGPLSAEAQAFLQTMNGTRKQFATPVAGFVRWTTREDHESRFSAQLSHRGH